MGILTRRKFVGMLAFSGIFSLSVLNRVWATNTLERLDISWTVPADQKDTVKNKLTSFKGEIKPDNVRSPLLYLFVGTILLTELCNAISLLLCQTSPGIKIYEEDGKLRIETDPNLFKGMAVIHKRDGTIETIGCPNSHDSSELYKKLYEKLSE